LYAVIEIFGFFTIGIIARICGYIKEQYIDAWSKFAIDYLYPFLIFSTIIQKLHKELLFEVWPLPIIGFGLTILGLILGLIFQVGLFTSSKDIKKAFIHFCTINNSAYLPIVIAQAIWGETAVVNLFLLNLGSTVGLWTIGIAVLQKDFSLKSIRNVLSSNLIVTVISIIIGISNLGNIFPSVLMHVCDKAGSIAVPLILTITGATIANSKAFKINWHVFYISAMRLAIFPVFAIAILKLLPLSNDVFSISVLVSLMPVAVSSVLLIRRYGGSPEYASSTAFYSTAFALVSIPVAISILF
jgi:predicted permease